MADMILDVPFYRQNDDQNGLTPFWQKRGCGLLALKMAMDYYRAQTDEAPIDLKELFDRAMDNGGVNADGNWIHSGLVKTAASYGYRAWRRNWHISAHGKDVFTKEGVDVATMALIDLQHTREALPTLVDALEHGYPVIISVAKNFDEVEKPHLVVLTGIKRHEDTGGYEGIYYNDPYSPTKKDRKDRYAPVTRFNEKWNHLAIFVEPKS